MTLKGQNEALASLNITNRGDFPCGPMVKNPRFHRRRCGFEGSIPGRAN